MAKQRIKKRIKIPKTKHYKKIRAIASLNAALLVLNFICYFWISEPGVFRTKAAQVGLCLKICAQGDCQSTSDECNNLLSPKASPAEPIIRRGETTILRGGSPIVSPLTAPLGLISAEELKKFLIPAKDNRPVFNDIKMITADNLAPTLFVAGQKLILPFSSSFLTFHGKTNIKDALIIITLTANASENFYAGDKADVNDGQSQATPQILPPGVHFLPGDFYATTKADSNGEWSWTVPQILPSGSHFLTVLAMSPSNAAVKEVVYLEFAIEYPPVETPSLPPETQPGEPQILPLRDKASAPNPQIGISPEKIQPPEEIKILPPFQLPPIEITKEIYVLNLKVIPREKAIYPGSQLDLVADVISFDPTQEEETTLKFKIINENNEEIFTDQVNLRLKNSLQVIKRLKLAANFKLGNYLAAVELTKRGVTYIATVSFPVEEKTLIVLPGQLKIHPAEVQQGLFISFIFLIFLLILFLLLLWCEYQKAKREFQITEQNLWQTGEIT